MKKIKSKLALILTIFPLTLFAHPGHEHSGTFINNFTHFMTTNIFIFAPLGLAGYFLFKYLFSRQKIKNSNK